MFVSVGVCVCGSGGGVPDVHGVPGGGEGQLDHPSVIHPPSAQLATGSRWGQLHGGLQHPLAVSRRPQVSLDPFSLEFLLMNGYRWPPWLVRLVICLLTSVQ